MIEVYSENPNLILSPASPKIVWAEKKISVFTPTVKILVWGFHKFLENLPTMTLTRKRFLGKVIFVIKKVLVLISQWSKKLTALKVNLQVAG